MRVIRASECREMPWKNGGGSTVEIVAEPEDATLDAFDWRISMARVASDGPFSHFPDIDRTLVVLEGNGLVLTIDDNPPVTLDRHSAPISFAGDIPTSARLVAGAITDLNVMTRRGRYRHKVEHIARESSRDLAESDIAVVVSLGERTAVASRARTEMLGMKDAAVLALADSPAFRVVPHDDGGCYLVWLRKEQ
jgi:environmental stress-induced protein Ves